jgi:dihydroxyacetone kinase
MMRQDQGIGNHNNMGITYQNVSNSDQLLKKIVKILKKGANSQNVPGVENQSKSKKRGQNS